MPFSQSHFPTKPKQYFPYLSLAVVSIVLHYFFQVMQDGLGYADLLTLHIDTFSLTRTYSVFTAHLLHTNDFHLWINIFGILVLWLLHGEYMNWSQFALLYIAICSFVSLGLFVYSDTLMSYVGLSGLLHGIFAWGVILDISNKRKTAYILLLGLVIKLIDEQYSGPSEQLADMISANVAINAHLYGAIAGGILGALTVKNKLINQIK